MSESNEPMLQPVSEEEFRAALIKHGHIEPWEPTPDGGAFYCGPDTLPTDSEGPE